MRTTALLIAISLTILTTHSQCLLQQQDTPWTTTKLSVWLKSTQLRRISRDLARYGTTQASIFASCADTTTINDYDLCSHGIMNGNKGYQKSILLHCSRGTLIATLLSDWVAARALLSRAVLTIPPRRWARLGIGQAAIALLSSLQQEGRRVNTKFLQAWTTFSSESMRAKQKSSKKVLAGIFDAIVEAAGTPSLDSGVTLPALKALLYRHEFGSDRWGRPLEYITGSPLVAETNVEATEINSDGTTATTATATRTAATRTAATPTATTKPLYFSDSITVLCRDALRWLRDNVGTRAIENPSRPENYVDLTYPVRALLGVFQNLLFAYDLADSQQESHTLSLYDKERCPKYTLPVIEYLNNLNFTKAHVFEFGCGGSTLWWLKRCDTITAVDTSEKWIDEVNKELIDKTRNRVQLLHRSNSLAPLAIDEKDLQHPVASGDRNDSGDKGGNGGGGGNDVARTMYDVILIDGAFSRYEAARASIKHLAKGGIILLDDADWYSHTSKYLRSQNLIQVDFHGPKPGDGAAWRSTSLFLHRDFVAKPRDGMVLPAPSRGGIALGSSWD